MRFTKLNFYIKSFQTEIFLAALAFALALWIFIPEQTAQILKFIFLLMVMPELQLVILYLCEKRWKIFSKKLIPLIKKIIHSKRRKNYQ